MNAVNKLPEQEDIDRALAASEAESLAGKTIDLTVSSLRSELETIANILKTPVESDPYAKESACDIAIQKARALVDDSVAGAEAAPAVDTAPVDVREIGPYKILALLGQGGMGAVYKALHPRLEKIVALKVLTPGRLKSVDAIGRFEREMKAIGKLDHPHLIRALDAGEADGAHYLAMEFVDGVDLSHFMKVRGPLPIADACELVVQAAAGLQAAHSRGMVHRDIKPANLMLARQQFGPPQVKVLDLGLALLSDTHAPDAGGLTSDGQVMGTVDYMAPEQANDSHAVDIRADIYSLGATLYALLTGGSLFQGKQNLTLMQKLVNLAGVPAPPIRERRPEVSPALAAVVHRMLEKDPSKRYATPTDVITALKPFTQGANLAALDAEVVRRTAADSSIDMSINGTILLDSVQRAAPTELQVAATAGHRQPPRRPVLAIAAAAMAAVGLFAVVAFTLKTPKGDVIVEMPDDLPLEIRQQIKISVTGDGVAEVASVANGWKIGIREGEYSVDLTGGGDELQVDGKQVTVSRNQTAIVKITTRPPRGSVGTGGQVARGTDLDAERRAAEWILSLHEGPSNLRVAIVGGQLTDAPNHQLPEAPFRVHLMPLGGIIVEQLGDQLAEELSESAGGIRPEQIVLSSGTLTATGFAKLVELPEFSAVTVLSLKCYDRAMDDRIFPLLAKLSGLKSLLLVPEAQLTGVGIGELKACPELTEVRWSGGSPRPQGLQELTLLPKLQQVGFADITCTEQHVLALSKLNVRELGLHACKVEDGSLRHLAMMDQLEMLGLTYNPLTDQGLSALKSLTNLSRLDLQGTMVTAAGIAELEQALPKCEIFWDRPQQ